MIQARQSSTHHVRPGDQAAALQHPLRAALLMMCVPGDRSVGELARELGVPLPKAHYHVTKLAECGLLRVARVRPRPGRPVKCYAAVAETFLVNLADLDEQASGGLARALRQSIAQVVNRRESFMCYHLDERGRPRVKLVGPDGTAPTDRAMDHWKIMRLSPDQRVALAREIKALIARYEDASPDAGEVFMVHAAFAPKLADSN